jgi:hypothetical protein
MRERVPIIPSKPAPSVSGLPEQETKELDELLERARPKIEFYKYFGRALSLTESQKIAGTWIGPECALEATFTEEHIKLVGSYEREAKTLC